MRVNITVVCLLLTMISATAESTQNHAPGYIGHCPRGWRSFNGHCYIVPDMLGDWEAAKTYCRALHGYLVEITSSGENTFVANMLTLATSPRMQTIESRPHCEHSEYFARSGWIGLSDQASESHFKWSSSGRAAGFTNWMTSPRQPDNAMSIEHCVELYNGADYRWRFQWNDKQCQCFRAFVCEREATHF